jgi:hypothetical protein
MQNKIIFSAQYIRQFGLSLITFLIFVPPVWPAAVSQRTEGSCSPAVADVKGDVKMSFVCEGVDPALLKEIVKLLNEILQDTKKLEQIRQELDKTSKRTDQIEAGQAPRRLAAAQREEIHRLLSGKSGAPIEIHGIANDAESMQYAEDLASALMRSGWKVLRINAAQIIGRIPIGLSLRIKDPNDPPAGTQLLLELFHKVGLEITSREAKGLSPNLISIMVGAKP